MEAKEVETTMQPEHEVDKRQHHDWICSVALARTLPPSVSFTWSTFISAFLWLRDLSSPNFWTVLSHLSSLWTSEEWGGTWGACESCTPCQCCCERKISGWRERGREGDMREGGNMWEGAFHMDTGCCQDRGREAVLSLSLANTHAHCYFQEHFASFISCDGEKSGGLYLHKSRGQTFRETKRDGKWVPCVTVTAGGWIWWTYGSWSWCLKVGLADLYASELYVLEL